MIADLIDVIGDPSRYGQPATLAPLLSMLDIACGRCSALYSDGPVVTGCFDELNLHTSLSHGHVVAVVCQVASTGKSSMLLRFLASTYEPSCSEKQPQLIATGYATFVAVDPVSKRSRAIPKTTSASYAGNRTNVPHIRLLLEQKLVQPGLSASFAAQRKQLREDSVPEKQLNFLEHLKSISFNRLMHVHETEITIRRHFLPRNENYGGVVFGGDILETFENAALSCASRMQQKPMQTKAIQSISFLAAVQRSSMLHVKATVIACTHQYVIVLIRSFIDQESNRFSLQPSHYGVFYLTTQDSEKIEVGVQTWENSLDDDVHRALSLHLSHSTPFLPLQPVAAFHKQGLS